MFTEPQIHYEALNYNPSQSTIDNQFYQQSLQTENDNQNINIRAFQKGEGEMGIVQPQDDNDNGTRNDLAEVDSYSKYQALQQPATQSNDSQQLHMKYQEHLQPDPGQDFAISYDSYNRNTSSHPAYEVSSIYLFLYYKCILYLT